MTGYSSKTITIKNISLYLQIKSENSKGLDINYNDEFNDFELNDLVKKKNRIKILISTTVVEVGLDVPNATIMLVEHAERFGLTQLHQLRGRVGRGSEKSYCILVKRNHSNMSRTRLAIMERTNDGFRIADEDLKLRGPGEVFGQRQSGFFQYKIADIVKDGEIIREARELAFELVKLDPNLQMPFNKDIKKVFAKKYSHYLEDLKLI